MDVPIFDVAATATGAGLTIAVSAGGRSRTYAVPRASQQDLVAFFAALADDFGTRLPHGSAASKYPAPDPRWRPLLTEDAHPHILAGYGDPAVLKTDDGYWLVATSNDAPDAFPLFHSHDLGQWQARGFVFPAGEAPRWAATGRDVADFWAPEMVRVGDEYWLCFTARQASGALAIGLARSERPEGPWSDNGEPLIVGETLDFAGLGLVQAYSPPRSGVIDSHIFVDADGAAHLLWKEDRNGIWPRPLATLLKRDPALISALFESAADRRTAAFAAALVGWANTQPPMVRFFLMQPLIEAVLADFARIRAALGRIAPAIAKALTTAVRIQRLAVDGRALVGESRILLTNDREWEGHLIEGPFVTRNDGRYYLFYAGNDFSTASYGIGVAAADALLGPYIKQDEPLLRSTRAWLAPGHASVAPGLDGGPQLFFHAFRPGTGGYNAFRALLTVGLRFADGQVSLVAPDSPPLRRRPE
ncbi:MAG: glycoside hydrolase family 43 protein [Sphingomicrobium sp.]